MRSRSHHVALLGIFLLAAAPAAQAEVKFEVAKALWSAVAKLLPGAAAVGKSGGAATAAAGKTTGVVVGTAAERVGTTAIKLGAACLAFAKMAVPLPNAGESSRAAFRLAAVRCEAERSKK